MCQPYWAIKGKEGVSMTANTLDEAIVRIREDLAGTELQKCEMTIRVFRLDLDIHVWVGSPDNSDFYSLTKRER